MLETARLPGRAAAEHYAVPWLLRLPYPLRNVLRRWRGTIGMVLGVGISLGLVMTILAISAASIELYTGDYKKSGASLYVITQGGKMIAQLPGDTPGTIAHSRHVLAQIRALPSVESALGTMMWSLERERPGPRRRDEPKELISVVGVDGDPTEIRNALVVKAGRWLRRTDEVFLGEKLAREKGLAEGDTLRLGGRDFTVVGLGKLRGSGFSADSLAYLDLRALRQRAEVGDVVNLIAIQTDRPEAVRERVLGLESLTPYTVPEIVRLAEEANQAGVIFRYIMAGLSLAVAALFVGNMLGRSVAERRLEFATLRAIGIPRRTILLIVAAEACLISVVASGLGIGISLFFGFLINATLAPQYGFESLYVADPPLFGVVFLLAVGLGLLAGLFPARSATRVDPVEVLREA